MDSVYDLHPFVTIGSDMASRTLNEFVKAFNNLQQFNVSFYQKLVDEKKLPDYIIKMALKSKGFNGPDWQDIDIRTRVSIRALDLCNNFTNQLLPVLADLFNVSFKNKDINKGLEFLGGLIAKPLYLKPLKIDQAIKVLDKLVDNYLRDTYKERVALDCVIDCLKTCANFLISLFTLGHSPAFFDTTAGPLEQLKTHYDSVRSIHNKLSAVEKSVPLLCTKKGLVLPEENQGVQALTRSLF